MVEDFGSRVRGAMVVDLGLSMAVNSGKELGPRVEGLVGGGG